MIWIFTYAATIVLGLAFIGSAMGCANQQLYNISDTAPTKYFGFMIVFFFVGAALLAIGGSNLPGAMEAREQKRNFIDAQNHCRVPVDSKSIQNMTVFICPTGQEK
jgi:hypothetical protein